MMKLVDGLRFLWSFSRFASFSFSLTSTSDQYIFSFHWSTGNGGLLIIITNYQELSTCICQLGNTQRSGVMLFLFTSNKSLFFGFTGSHRIELE